MNKSQCDSCVRRCKEDADTVVLNCDYYKRRRYKGLYVCRSRCVNPCVDRRPHKHNQYCKVRCFGKPCLRYKQEVKDDSAVRK